MQTTDMPITSIKPYKRNARIIHDSAIDAVAESIKQFGFRQPIVIDNSGVVIVGHTRLLAAKKLELKTVPVHIADTLTDEQVKAYRIADNSTGALTEWDIPALELELAELEIDMSEYGIPEFDAEDNVNEALIEKDDNESEIESKPSSRVKRGQVYKLGEHRLMIGDTTKAADMKKLMGDTLADCVITDPPYNVAYTGKTKDALTIENDDMSAAEFRTFLEESFTNLAAHTSAGSGSYIFHASIEAVAFTEAFNAAGFTARQRLVWVKNTLVLGRHDYQWRHEPIIYGWREGAAHKWYGGFNKTTILEYNKPARSEIHPTSKPVDLIAALVQNSSLQGDVVLDGFGGSGSTLMACEATNRRCFMMEYDEAYASEIIQRWENATGDKAVMDNDASS